MFGEDIKNRIDEAVHELHFVGENNVIELYADYRDTSDFLLQTVYDNRNSKDLEALVQDQICGAYFEERWRCEDEVLKATGFEGTDLEEEAREYLRETYAFEPPFDHFLDQTMKVNIMLATDEEQNQDCVSIHTQYLAMGCPEEVWDSEKTLQESSGLSWLLKQQGHTMAELQATLKDYNAFFYDEDGCVRDLGEGLKGVENATMVFNQNHDAFLTSVCQELENQRYSMGVMTVLAEMSIREFIEMQQGEKQITMPQNTDIGIFNPWVGAGSCLEIELKKPLVFSTDMIRDVQVEGAKMEFEYSVDSVYGLVGSCWKPVGTIEEVSRDEKEFANAQGEKPALDDVIKDCAAQAGSHRDSMKKDLGVEL